MSVQYLQVSAELSEEIKSTQSHNSHDFKVREDKTFYAIAGTPSIFHYSDKKLGFTLPPTMLIVINTTSNIKQGTNKIRSISVNPQMTLLGIDDAIVVLKNLIKLFDDAGWKRRKLGSPNILERLKEIYSDEHSPERHYGNDSVFIAGWEDGDNNLTIEIKKQLPKGRLEKFADVLGGRAKTLKYEDLYLIEVFIDNFSLPNEREIEAERKLKANKT